MADPRTFSLNQRAQDLLPTARGSLDQLGIATRSIAGGTCWDCGIETPGSVEAGRLLAEVCLGGQGQVRLTPIAAGLPGEQSVLVESRAPIAACMASQYAGWQITGEKYFAMGSGPMRALAAREPLFEKLGIRESSDHAVGVLETRKFPTEAVWQDVAAKCKVAPERLTLLVAPTASIAGNLQIVARSLETALHKMLELGFDPSAVRSGRGIAPLPPVAKDDLQGIGRTNDAVLYGAHVTVWVNGEDAYLAEFVERVPSSASHDHGVPFAEIFARYNHDFYKIDPHLFSPAVITLVNIATGKSFTAGELAPEVLRQSFA
ncbi:MAG: methenyltetrahydromethanopterin cyclohydrolase [Planctomycetia bacterium]|nr:methenyltetrahydromethanopterin cyclohydrolase [Planctomycetia bacterium]